MTEMKSTGNNAPATPGDLQPSSAGIPVEPVKSPGTAAAGPGKIPEMVDEKNPVVTHDSQAQLEAKASSIPGKQIRAARPPRMAWAILTVIFLLLVVAVFFIGRPRQKSDTKGRQAVMSSQEEKPSAVDYTSVMSKSLLTQAPKYSEIILTDDIFAGQAPRLFKTDGPVISQDSDPQLAALAEAFKNRLEMAQGSQWIVRGTMRTRVIKGAFFGFTVNAIERTEDQKAAFSEITIMTPKRGIIKTVNHILASVKETDFPRFGNEIQAAGLDFFMLPAPADEKTVRMQLRPTRFSGKPIAGELLITGKSVGKIMLGMPISGMEKLFIESHIVLKRKILVKDTYFDVYKILDKSNEPLFYVYENKGRIWGISLISDIFKTEKGIGIGSSLGLMRISYPFIKLGYSEKMTPVVQLEGVAGLFIIQGDGINFSKKVFPNENRVISILVGESPEFE